MTDYEIRYFRKIYIRVARPCIVGKFHASRDDQDEGGRRRKGYLPIIEKNTGGSLWEEGALKRVNGSTEVDELGSGGSPCSQSFFPVRNSCTRSNAGTLTRSCRRKRGEERTREKERESEE